MQHYEMRLLADYLQPAAQAANTWNRPIPAAVGGELEQDERGEVVYAEIIPPVGPGPGFNDEDLRKVIIVLDGVESGKYVSLSGVRTNLMAPPKDRIWNGRLYSFGTPHNSNPLLNTTLKYRQTVTVACLAGANPAGITGATQPYRVRLWGYVYKEAELPGVFGTMAFPVTMIDSARRRSLVLSKRAISVNGDTWLTLPGGKDQSIPKINPFARYAYNLANTNGLQGDYQMRQQIGGVLDADENMYFDFDDKDAVLIEGLGVAPANDVATLTFLARTGLRIGSDYHPKGPTTATSLIPTFQVAGLVMNPINFGQFTIAFPGGPAVPPFDTYVAIPKLDRPYLIWNEIGYVVIRDDGLGVVPADPAGVVVAMTGIRIEMRG